ncbi:ECF-type sigma factor [Thalassoroseus pseudoceratinae]|uniref:ECF-type sigma factor n=1 Tax=Thalassoroseus pseudoceratinae TaxID=2713176 RepID=UPI001421E7C3|nr:ECF-type sigma factor [Thalassoroseus pseudoceratinae]
MPNSTDISHPLYQIQTGKEGELFPRLYELACEELKDMARQLAAREQTNFTSGELVQETYRKLYSDNVLVKDDERRHFFGIAGRAIRQILVDQAESRQSSTTDGEHRREPFDLILETLESERNLDFLEFEEGLVSLEEQFPQLQRVVLMRFFAGLTTKQIAQVLSISESKVEGDWRLARAWLYRFLRNGSRMS